MHASSIVHIVSMVWYNVVGMYCLNCGSFQNTGCMKSTSIHGIVCFVNSFCALLQVAHLDTLHYFGRPIQYLKYVEWSICAPLMALEIMVCAKFTEAQVCLIIVLTFAFCLCGFIAAFSVVIWIKVLLGIQGSLYTIIVIGKLWSISLDPVKQRDCHLNGAIANLLMASLIWPTYIITWGLGPDMSDIISADHELIYEQIASLILKSFALSYAFLTSNSSVEGLIETLADFVFGLFNCLTSTL